MNLQCMTAGILYVGREREKKREERKGKKKRRGKDREKGGRKEKKTRENKCEKVRKRRGRGYFSRFAFPSLLSISLRANPLTYLTTFVQTVFQGARSIEN